MLFQWFFKIIKLHLFFLSKKYITMISFKNHKISTVFCSENKHVVLEILKIMISRHVLNRLENMKL